MPWFAWLFLSLTLVILTWWVLDERSYSPPVLEEADLTALARAVGVYVEKPRLTAQEAANLRYRLVHDQRTSSRITRRDNT